MNINKILRANPVSSKYGAPMGESNKCQSETPLYLQRVRMVDGDYSPGGVYWGNSPKHGALWCAFNGADCPDYAPWHGTHIYVRAHSRAQAMAFILEEYDVTFKKVTK